jgi:xylitol oxidase
VTAQRSDADRANWAGTYTFTAPRIEHPETVEDVARLVRESEHVHALGTRHSFTDLPDTEGTLVQTDRLRIGPTLDTTARRVNVGAGTRYGVLAEWLHGQGWALHNMGSLPHISIAGATATGTHGSGDRLGILSTAVSGLEFVTSDGSVERIARGGTDFDGLVVGIGAFGVISSVTLDVEPTYDVRQDVYTGLTWDALLDDPDEIFGAAYSVSVFAKWATEATESILLKSRIGVDGPSPDRLAGARIEEAGAVVPASVTQRGGVPGPWSLRLPHFRLDATPSIGEELQAEYFVPRDLAVPALRAVRELADRIDPVLGMTELRTTAADSLWLSGSADRDTFAIAFTFLRRPAEVYALLPDLEAALRPFGARPHWGKAHTFDAARIAEVWPRAQRARELFDRLDPRGAFVNPHLRRLGLR